MADKTLSTPEPEGNPSYVFLKSLTDAEPDHNDAPYGRSLADFFGSFVLLPITKIDALAADARRDGATIDYESVTMAFVPAFQNAVRLLVELEQALTAKVGKISIHVGTDPAYDIVEHVSVDRVTGVTITSA